MAAGSLEKGTLREDYGADSIKDRHFDSPRQTCAGGKLRENIASGVEEVDPV
jgi:hypothetical protein